MANPSSILRPCLRMMASLSLVKQQIVSLAPFLLSVISMAMELMTF